MFVNNLSMRQKKCQINNLKTRNTVNFEGINSGFVIKKPKNITPKSFISLKNKYTEVIQNKIKPLQNNCSVLGKKISKVMDFILPWGKGKHIEEVIEDGKVIGNKYTKTIKENKKKVGVVVTYGMKKQILELEKASLDGSWKRVQKAYPDGVLKEDLYLEGNHSILKKYDITGEMTEIYEKFPNGNEHGKKYNGKELVEMTQVFPFGGGMVRENYKGDKTVKRFTLNANKSSLEENFTYEKGKISSIEEIRKDSPSAKSTSIIRHPYQLD